MDHPIENNYTPHLHREGYKIIQIHPTLNCNLSCIHCYSESLPGLKKALDVEVLKKFISTVGVEGYDTIAISGGEPFIYSPLKELLKFTKQEGFYNSVTSNGGLLKSKRNQDILQYIDLIALSVDGKREEHNRIRNSSLAFDQMLHAIEILKAHKKTFGFIHLLHNESIDIIGWLCSLAVEHGAKLIHLHPFENAGRGKTLANQLAMDDLLLQKFYILFHFYKQKHSSDFTMQLDLLHREILLQFPQLAYHYDCEDICDTNYFRELIIDENGFILPVSHGFNRKLALGNIYEEISLSNMIARFRKEKLSHLKAVYETAFNNILVNPDEELINLSDYIIKAANESELVI